MSRSLSISKLMTGSICILLLLPLLNFSIPLGNSILGPVTKEYSEEDPRAGLPLEGVKICIDPGHGLYWHSDSSSWKYQRGFYWGLVEDQITVDIAKYLTDYLQQYTKAQVYATRELNKNAGVGISGQEKWKEGSFCYLRDEMGDAGNGDKTRDLYIRPEYANKIGADIFLSIHTNGATGSARGTMTLWGGLDEGGSGAGSPANDKALAQKIHPPLVAEAGTIDRGIWKDQDMSGFSLCVLRETDMPASLVEVAFHDNYDDNQLLQQEWFKKASARGMLFGICDYYGVPRPVLDLPQGVHNLTRVSEGEGNNTAPWLWEGSNGEIFFTWEHSTKDYSQIHMRTTNDRGNTWNEASILTPEINNFNGDPALAQTKDGTYFCAYESSRNNAKNIFYKLSGDGGQTWGSEKTLTNSLPGRNKSQPAVYRTAYGTLWVSLTIEKSDGSGTQVFFCYSVDNGNTFSEPTSLSNLGNDSSPFNIQTSDNKLWTVFSGGPPGSPSRIYQTNSPTWTDWTDPTPITPQIEYPNTNPCLVEKSSGDLLLFYESDRTDDGEENADIFFILSENNGASWSREMLLTSALTHDEKPCSFKLSDGKVWVAYGARDASNISNIFLTNNFNDFGNRFPICKLMQPPDGSIQDLEPTISFQSLDYEGQSISNQIYLSKGNAPLSELVEINGSSFSIETPLEDESWYTWDVKVSDGINSSFSVNGPWEFYVDVNHAPTATPLDPADESRLSGDIDFLDFKWNMSDRDLWDASNLRADIYWSADKDIDENTTWKALVSDLSEDFFKADTSLFPSGTWCHWFLSIRDANQTTVNTSVYSFMILNQTQNQPPVVPSLDNRSVILNGTLTLSANGSYDPDGNLTQWTWWVIHVEDNLGFAWEMSLNELLNTFHYKKFNGSEVNVRFQDLGSHIIVLQVTDDGAFGSGSGRSAMTRFVLDVLPLENPSLQAPFAMISAPATVIQDELLKLDGNGSYDIDGYIVNFTWIIKGAEMDLEMYGPEVDLTLNSPQILNVHLKVTDDMGLMGEAGMNITVIPKENPGGEEGWGDVFFSMEPQEPLMNDTVVIKGFAGGKYSKVTGLNWTWSITSPISTRLIFGEMAQFNIDSSGTHNVSLLLRDISGDSVVVWKLFVVPGEIKLPEPDDTNQSQTNPGVKKGVSGWFISMILMVGILMLAALVAVFIVLKRRKSDNTLLDLEDQYFDEPIEVPPEPEPGSSSSFEDIERQYISGGEERYSDQEMEEEYGSLFSDLPWEEEGDGYYEDEQNEYDQESLSLSSEFMVDTKALPIAPDHGSTMENQDYYTEDEGNISSENYFGADPEADLFQDDENNSNYVDIEAELFEALDHETKSQGLQEEGAFSEEYQDLIPEPDGYSLTAAEDDWDYVGGP